ncbi:MAG: lipopolysaccharide biosynthesis protein, partial [bacterium]
MKNIVCARISDKMYPYINDATSDKIPRKEFFSLLKDCSALFIYRLNGVVLKATDNIVLSKFMGLGMVGLYSNYALFYTTLNTLYSKIFNSVSHSLGNLHTTKNLPHEYKVYKAVNLITMI